MPVARHCSQCGARLSAAPPTRCGACGAEHWNDGKACANVIVERADGKILLVLRDHDPWRGLWCAPGGFCEVLERPDEAARREAREEAAIDVEIRDLLGIWVDVYADDAQDEDAVWISVAYYAGEADGDATADGVEVAEARWFAPDELPDGLAPPGTLADVLRVWEARRARMR